MDSYNILIADDHAAIRVGVRHILERAFPALTFGEAETGQEVMCKIVEEGWDLMILDINLPGKNGLEILHEIRSRELELKTLVFSIHSEDQMAIRCLKAGADAYLTKNKASTELVKAVRNIQNGKVYVPPTLARLLARQIHHTNTGLLHHSLSDREYQIMLRIAEGNSLTDIADELNLSVSSVATYRSRILKKLGMKNNAALIQYVIKNNLLEL